MNDRKIILRAIVKLLAIFSLLWLSYIFLIGLFKDNYTPDTASYRFDISSIQPEQSAMFDIDRRAIIVINTASGYAVFWADDPIYGCRLAHVEATLQPVCIQLEYRLDGTGINTDQHLKQPDYNILGTELIVNSR